MMNTIWLAWRDSKNNSKWNKMNIGKGFCVNVYTEEEAAMFVLLFDWQPAVRDLCGNRTKSSSSSPKSGRWKAVPVGKDAKTSYFWRVVGNVCGLAFKCVKRQSFWVVTYGKPVTRYHLHKHKNALHEKFAKIVLRWLLYKVCYASTAVTKRQWPAGIASWKFLILILMDAR